jgi:hypothetical protein
LLDTVREARDSNRGARVNVSLTAKIKGEPMPNATELMYLRQMLGTDSWVQAVFLAGVFLVIVFRRDHIVSPYMFRVSIILYVLSLILPITITSILQYTASTRGVGFIGSGSGGELFHTLMPGVGPAVFGLSVLLCILSMLPERSRYPAPPQRQPQSHPLD